MKNFVPGKIQISMKNLLLSFLLITLFSCSSKKSEQEDLHKNIIAVHNEVMPRMEEIAELSKKLKENVVKLEKEKPENTDKITSVKQSINNLNSASQGMMNWMHRYNAKYDTLPIEISIKYLKEEKLKIEKVKSEMNKAIEEAKLEI